MAVQAAQVEIPAGTAKPTRVDLYISPDGRIGGVAGTEGVRRGSVSRGQTYWSASVDYAARPRAVFADGLKMEALLGRVQRGETLRVPAYRHDRWHSGFALRDAAGNDLQRSAVSGSPAISSSGKRIGGLTYRPPRGAPAAARVVLRAGCLYTVGHVLYQYDGSAGDELDATSGDLAGIFPAPAYSAGDAVELDAPYFVGLLQAGVSIRLARTGDRFGPWTIEGLVEVPRA